jgi:hypothetical protein
MIRNLADTPSSLHDSRQWGTRSRRDAHREPPRRKTEVHRREGPEQRDEDENYILRRSEDNESNLFFAQRVSTGRFGIRKCAKGGLSNRRFKIHRLSSIKRDNGTSSQRTLGRRSSVLRLQFLSPRTSTNSSGLTFRDDDITPAHLQCPEVSRLASLQSAMLPSR